MNGNFQHMIKGLLYAFISLTVLIITVSLILWMTNMNMRTLTVLIYFLHGICLLIGGFVAGKRIQNKGWYYGGMLGIIYGIIIILIGILGFQSTLNMATLSLFVLSFSSGALGGMIGVNVQR